MGGHGEVPFLSKSSAASSGEGGLLPCLAVCAEMARNGVAVGHESRRAATLRLGMDK